MTLNGFCLICRFGSPAGKRLQKSAFVPTQSSYSVKYGAVLCRLSDSGQLFEFSCVGAAWKSKARTAVDPHKRKRQRVASLAFHNDDPAGCSSHASSLAALRCGSGLPRLLNLMAVLEGKPTVSRSFLSFSSTGGWFSELPRSRSLRRSRRSGFGSPRRFDPFSAACGDSSGCPASSIRLPRLSDGSSSQPEGRLASHILRLCRRPVSRLPRLLNLRLGR